MGKLARRLPVHVESRSIGTSNSEVTEGRLSLDLHVPVHRSRIPTGMYNSIPINNFLGILPDQTCSGDGK